MLIDQAISDYERSTEEWSCKPGPVRCMPVEPVECSGGCGCAVELDWAAPSDPGMCFDCWLRASCDVCGCRNEVCGDGDGGCLNANGGAE